MRTVCLTQIQQFNYIIRSGRVTCPCLAPGSVQSAFDECSDLRLNEYMNYCEPQVVLCFDRPSLPWTIRLAEIGYIHKHVPAMALESGYGNRPDDIVNGREQSRECVDDTIAPKSGRGRHLAKYGKYQRDDHHCDATDLGLLEERPSSQSRGRKRWTEEDLSEDDCPGIRVLENFQRKDQPDEKPSRQIYERKR